MYTVMIVDDEQLEIDVLSIILSREFKIFNNIISAKNGKEAILKAKESKPDLILMDISLPEIDGLCALEKIKSFLPNVNVLMLTSHSKFDYIQRAMRLGAKDYLLKPLRTEDLITSINKIFKDIKDIKNINTKINNNNKSREKYLYIDKSKSDIVKNSIIYINKNYKNKIDLNTISNEIHINHQYLSRVFKKEIGMSCIDYINELRVNNACEMLTETTYPAYRIACDSGFSDSAYFSRVFAKHIKLTPSEYRKTYLQSSISI